MMKNERRIKRMMKNKRRMKRTIRNERGMKITMKDERMTKRNNKGWKGDGKMIKDEVKNEIKKMKPKTK
jgi:hypothetical protein